MNAVNSSKHLALMLLVSCASSVIAGGDEQHRLNAVEHLTEGDRSTATARRPRVLFVPYPDSLRQQEVIHLDHQPSLTKVTDCASRAPAGSSQSGRGLETGTRPASPSPIQEESRDTAGARTLSLGAGWNLVSVPSDMHPRTPSALFGDGVVGKVWGWDSVPGSYRIMDDELLDTAGYWVYAPQAQSIPCPPDRLTITVASSTTASSYTFGGWPYETTIRPKTGYTLVLVTLSVRNSANVERRFSSPSFSIVDEDGNDLDRDDEFLGAGDCVSRSGVLMTTTTFGAGLRMRGTVSQNTAYIEWEMDPRATDTTDTLVFLVPSSTPGPEFRMADDGWW